LCNYMEKGISARISWLCQKINELHCRYMCEPSAEASALSNVLAELRQEFECLIDAHERDQTERRHTEAAILV